MIQESKADIIGYKHPPQEHQFRRGQSGNPSGRPKGSRNFKSELREELNELIRFRDGDREIEVSKQRALIKRLVASAIAGDQRASATLLGLCVRAFADADDDDAVEAPRIARLWKHSANARSGAAALLRIAPKQRQEHNRGYRFQGATARRFVGVLDESIQGNELQ
jgi:hypothetical protein